MLGFHIRFLSDLILLVSSFSSRSSVSGTKGMPPVSARQALPPELPPLQATGFCSSALGLLHVMWWRFEDAQRSRA